MSTLRIGTDVNIHCKLLDCTSPPKNPKTPKKKCQKLSNNFHLSIRTRCAKFFKLNKNIVVRRMKCLYLITNSILLFKWFFLSPKEGREKFLEWGGGQLLLKSSNFFVKKFVCSQEMMMHAHHQFNPSSSAQRRFQRKRMESLGMRRRRCCQLIRELAL